MKLKHVAVAALGLLVASVAAAQTIQKVKDVGAQPAASGAPTFTVSVSAVSAAATALTAGSCYRVACNGPVFFRTGTSTPTALTTDAPIFGPSVEKICLPPTDTAFAFVTASGTATCIGTKTQ